MEIKIDLDLPGIIAQACATERLQPLIDKAIGDALKSAINEATGYRSAFSEALKSQLIEALPHGLGVDDVAKFQQVLNQAVAAHVHGANAETVATALEKVVRDAMPDVPAVLKMSELLEAAREGFHKERHESFYAYYEPCGYGGGRLYLDDDEHPGQAYGSRTRDREDVKYQAKHCIAFTKDGDVYALRLDGKDLTPASRPNVVGRFDAMLMSMYVGRTRINVDMDDDDVRCAAQEQND